MDDRLVLQSVIGGLFNGTLYGVAAIGLALVFGVAKIVNLAHGAFILVGMYLVYALNRATGWDPLLLVVPTIVGGLVLGYVVQWLLISRLMGRGDGPLLVTLGVWIAIESLCSMIFGSQPQNVTSALSTRTFSIGAANFYWSRLAVLGLAVAFTLALAFVLQRTDLGRGIRAVAQDPLAAQLMGLNVARLLAATMALGAGAAFFAGGLSASVVPVAPGVATNLLLMSFVAAVLGGLGNIGGAFAAGTVIGVIEGVGSLFLPGTMKVFVVFVVFIVCLLVRPEGLRRRA
ncbi:MULTISPECIES: branched-chain amino acid ABC transporter permease [unclassified Nocardioides]|uniref:branched-chain amino acid ABC transporter permease n=1 Tax=unclassified Nocardioides TaxID=2615069 RepID=UPI0009EFEDDD|nr:MULTISPECIES: branched-chain amino acid ABC transporter permease [unclassified Nocardioides]GAW49159.1 Putative Branched-chain amino acid ABC transporter (Permease protein) livH-like protein [Nocardioides sp. PD653-B2]GAW55647.1 putative Branched-chain amino acid ABC transport er (Permease protein) livH-like protein [Nocardioides sp. PD653]